MFNVEWENNFLFAENFFGKPECLICKRTMARINKFYVERHYLTCHSEYVNITGDARNCLILDLKKNSLKNLF